MRKPPAGNHWHSEWRANAGMYSDAGHKGTIALTDDGLVFSGFKNEGFLVPEYDDSRLFLKDERVEDMPPNGCEVRYLLLRLWLNTCLNAEK